MTALQSTEEIRQLSTARQRVEQYITDQRFPSKRNRNCTKKCICQFAMHAEPKSACFPAPAGAPGHEAAAGTCREGASFGAAAAAAESAREGAGEASARAACFQPDPQEQGAL